MSQCRTRPLQGKKDRAIDLQLPLNAMMMLVKFLYSPQHQKTIAEALVGCVYNVIHEKFPSEFGNPLMKESALFIRRKKLKDWKFQKTINIQPTGGLNYCSIESIQKYVEEIPKYKTDMIPSSKQSDLLQRNWKHTLLSITDWK
jgi:hypothetical protein